MNTQVRTKTRTRANEHANVKTEVSRGFTLTIGAVSGLIGSWAMAAFIGGMIAAGGPLEFAKSWFQAVLGM